MRTLNTNVRILLTAVWGFISFLSISSGRMVGNRFEPPDGTCYIGVSPQNNQTKPLTIDEKTGLKHTAFSYFFTFPLSKEDRYTLQGMARDLKEDPNPRLLVITLEPWGGLDSVTPEACRELADVCAECDIPILVRFAHEMNASWYPWGQRPTQYKKVFRLLAETLMANAPNTGTIWSPISGLGYPFSFGQYACTTENPEFRLLDTNKDGKLCQDDDMYTPFYPGDDVVDWIGMGILHYGSQHALGSNTLPGEDLVDGILRGEYFIPSIYDKFCRSRNAKPLVITDTSALYDPNKGGTPEPAIKQAIIKQLYDPARLRKMKKLKMIIWLDKFKQEPCVQADIDWRVSNNPDVIDTYRGAIEKKGSGNRRVFLQAPDAAPWLK
ncbi:MAG: hypothetical protein EOM20_01365 [Spartobacteria bacterium]|nr:hypothetical protein [Spartobacteria bacterium]